MTGPVLYVLKRFPRLSETFVLRELLALEARGERILIDSLLPPEEGPRHPELAQLRAPVRQLPRHPRLRDAQVAQAHLRLAVHVPGRWLAMALRSRSDREAWRRFLQAGLVALRVRRGRAARARALRHRRRRGGRDAGALTGAPVTVTAHAKDVFHRDNAPLLSRRLRGAAAVVTVTDDNAAHLRRVLPGTPVHVVRNGVQLSPTRGATGRVPAALLCVARLVPKKGIDCLLSAVALLARQRPGVCLEVIGAGPLDAELRRQAQDLGISEWVDFRGPLPPPTSRRRCTGARCWCSRAASTSPGIGTGCRPCSSRPWPAGRPW